MSIYTNSTGRDTVRNAFEKHTSTSTELFLACPFFSCSDLITEMLSKSCSVRLIVRLGPSTDPAALRRLLGHPSVQIRFFTSRQFHSKLYIFGQSVALVGSANLTDSGIQSNREIAVEIASDDEEFDPLLEIFQTYWDQAQVLDAMRLSRYELLCRQSSPNPATSDLERTVLKEFGDTKPTGIQVDRIQQSHGELFAESFRRQYQEFLTAFQVVSTQYAATGRRKPSNGPVPIRIEIDSFFSFLRETRAPGEEYKTQPLRTAAEIVGDLRPHLEAWFAMPWPYFENEIPGKYAHICEAFASPEHVSGSSAEEIFDALIVCHAFHDRFRFYRGAMPTMRAAFIQDNPLPRIRALITHLLFGDGNHIDRMATCIFDEKHRLSHFGRACVQELYGWVNQEDVPICNGRTTKVLRWLGFNVKVIS